MNLNLRAGKTEDAEKLGEICYRAFKTISDAHNFPPDFPAPEAAVGLMNMMLNRKDIYSVVAELDGETVGSNFLWEGNQASGIGPITVDPNVQNSAIGKALMENVLRRSDEQGFLSVRLVQAAYHNRSLSLYTKLGFNTAEPLSLIQGAALNEKLEGYSVRSMTENDIDGSNRLCRAVHGLTRERDLRDGIGQGTAYVVEHDGRITGYTTLLGFFGHTVGESNKDLQALICSVPEFHGSGFLLPTRNSELMRWCLEKGLRVVQPMTLMSRGIYQEPRGAFFPSILF